MRVKLTVAMAVVVAAFGITSSAAWLSKADAQLPDVTGTVPPKPVELPLPTSGGDGPFFPDPLPGTAPPKPGQSHAGPPGAGVSGCDSEHCGSRVRVVEYKFVDVKPNRKEFEKLVLEHGKEGWEYVGSERFGGSEMTSVFKKHKGQPVRSADERKEHSAAGQRRTRQQSDAGRPWAGCPWDGQVVRRNRARVEQLL